MPVFDISGVSVKFPFEPYQVQRKYMERVIEALKNKTNAFLESPTGTGKTLSLLCATLGYIEHENGKRSVKYEKTSENGLNTMPADGNDVFRQNYISPNFQRVIYASRTHSQLLQAMNELKRTEYNYMKAGVVASRDQLCINEELKFKSNADKTYICQLLTEERCAEEEASIKPKERCEYYGNVMKGLEHLKLSKCSIPDIEELDRVGRLTCACPYYMSKEMVRRADIIFMPYNYLLDPKIRFANKIDLKNSIVILDEAHNVENMCEESACTLITSTKIGIAIRDMNYINENWKTLKDNIQNIEFSSVSKLAKIIENLETEIFNIEMKSVFGGDSYDGSYIFDLLNKAEIHEDNHELFMDHLHQLIGALVNVSRKQMLVTENGTVVQKCPSGIGLRAISSFLRVVFSSSAPHLRDRVDRCYKIFIEREPDKQTIVDGVKTTEKPHPKAKIINVWCFSAAFGIQYLLKQNLRSLILTSGTLAPLKPLIIEMDMPNSIQLENPHIVKPSQVTVQVIGHGPNNVLLDSSYRNRDKKVYLRSIGETILEFSKVVPDGLLVFFPSYSVMNKCTAFWRENGIWLSIDQQKKIFEEPRTKQEFSDIMKNYYATINDPDSRGAICMAVMRGKVSEGLDFADMYGRAVIVTGIPFGPCKDPKIILKKKYLKENRTIENEMLSGDEWYVLNAVRAINQAIGRVIRHKDDYGAILLCDNRFYVKSNRENISGWLKNRLNKSNQPFDSTIKDLRQFYEDATKTLPKPKSRSPVVEVSEDLSELSAFIELPTNDDMGTTEATQWRDNDDGPSPKTPFKNFGGESCCDTNQSGIERKRPKLAIDSNYNQNVATITDEENAVLKLAGRDFGCFKYEKLFEIFNKYKIDGQYESYRDSLFKIFKAERQTDSLRQIMSVIKAIHKIEFEKDLNTFLQLNK